VSPARARSAGSSRHPRRVALAGVCSWLAFALAWWQVVVLDALVTASTIVMLIGCALLFVALDVWWVSHNRRTYRQKGPRRGRPTVDRAFHQDRLGRPLNVYARAHSASEVTVFLTDDGTKVYRPAAR